MTAATVVLNDDLRSLDAALVERARAWTSRPLPLDTTVIRGEALLTAGVFDDIIDLRTRSFIGDWTAVIEWPTNDGKPRVGVHFVGGRNVSPRHVGPSLREPYFAFVDWIDARIADGTISRPPSAPTTTGADR